MNTLIYGLQYGDEGKGRVSAYFSKEYDWSIRFNGGSVAGDTPIYIKSTGDKNIEKTGLVQIGDFIDTFFKKDEEGYKNIDNYQTIGYLGNNTINDKIQYVDIEGIYRHKTNQIYNIKYSGGSIKLTTDHSIFVLRNDKIMSLPSSEIKVGDTLLSFPHKIIRKKHLIKNLSLENEECCDKIYYTFDNQKKEITNEFLELVGFYLAEGNASIRKRQRPNRKSVSVDYDLTFSFGTHEQDYIKRVIELMNIVFPDHAKNPNIFSPPNEVTETCIRYSRKELAILFSDLFGPKSNTKKLPNWVFQLSFEKFKILFDSYNKGDGDHLKNKRLSASTISRNLVIGFNWILNMHGIKSTIRNRKPTGKFNIGNTIYNLLLSKKRNFLDKDFDNNTHHFRFRKVKSIVVEKYCGFVYDLCGCTGEAFFGGESPVLLHNSNAGHTVWENGVQYKLNHLPAGSVLGKKVALDAGMVIDVNKLHKEYQTLINKPKLYISERAHVITEKHLQEDSGGSGIGSTKRGIAYVYRDKVLRRGRRIKEEFNDPKSPLHSMEVTLYKELPPIANNETAIYESAQGVMLDVDYGYYPFVTSSNVFPSIIHNISSKIGVLKAYTSRVGDGPPNYPDIPFLRELGQEYGTTTGRPRKCTWLVVEDLRYAIRISKPDSIVLTKVDILKNIPNIKVWDEGKEVNIGHYNQYLDFMLTNFPQIRYVSDSPQGDIKVI